MEAELAELRNQSNYVLESLAQILQRLDNLPSEDRLVALETRLSQISAEVSGLKLDVETDLAQLQGQYGRLRESLDGHFAQVQGDLETWKNAIAGKIEHLETDTLQKVSTQLETLETTVENLGMQSSQLLDAVTTITEPLQNLPETPAPSVEEQVLQPLLQLQTKLDRLAKEISDLQGRATQPDPAPQDNLQQTLLQIQVQLQEQERQLTNLQSLLTDRISEEESDRPSDLPSFGDRAQEWASRLKQGFEGLQSQMEFEPDLSQKDEWGDEDEWDTPSPAPTPQPTPAPVPVKSKTGWKCVRSLNYASSAVTCLAVSSDGKTLVTGGYEQMHVVDLNSYEVKAIDLDAEGLSVTSVALSRDGKTLAAATGEIEIWNVTTGRLLQVLECEDWTTVAAISSDGKTLVSGGSEPLEEKSSLRFWDFATGELIRTNYYVDYEIDSLGFNADGSMLAIAGRNPERYRGLIQVWQVGASSPQISLEVPMGLYSVALTPDGQMLAGGCGDRTIKLWNCSTRGLVRTFSGHEGIVYSVALNPDGKVLASGSHDQTVKLWNIETGEEVDTLLGHQGPVNAVMFGRDGKTLISASGDLTVKIWQKT
ncbi:hypothetical protein [Roseofilum casamattae]|uniref:WD40 repeat domain-containing protein n=1 Tax=Roseofilum casamattae BLCC-M143 TaxID=3022442 RepID=A0ABT7BXW4_9CYAN|nr:hypothetical protein [Roseofilum casamattae]MDJ1184031.1 hypothetical protein [Roseofilum casamattae BLCC-M143]